jgi:hypothetical protein
MNDIKMKIEAHPMVALCSYNCSYCRRPIETSFVTLGQKRYHAIENEFGESAERSCYELSEYGTKTLSGNLPPAPAVQNWGIHTCGMDSPLPRPHLGISSLHRRAGLLGCRSRKPQSAPFRKRHGALK